MNLALEGISKWLGDNRILHDVSLSLSNTRTLALIGPSGGGKSTLLRVMAGLIPVDTGRVKWDGNEIPLDPIALVAFRKKLGVVFQSYNLFPHLTVLENLWMPLVKARDWSRERAQESSLETLRRFELGEQADRKPHALSGGQRQRVAIARAIVAQPQVLIMDEPTSALDPLMVVEVLDMIRSVIDEGRDLILATHQIGFAEQVAERVAFVADGRIVELGGAKTLLRNPQTSACRYFLERVLKY